MQITKDELQAALATWEQSHRDGNCFSHEETAAKPVAVVAAESAEYLWALLSNGTQDSKA